ncbi:MAG: hypothetical protein Harvfovirus2_38 [Harvfovirus sp.]|uniref:Uncharacterized protein n=1 Tax=Harvfovirus sp. TaxID=2487768 RepID=A0A3G5A007_9VIRU|nr:MAG: hypothetical protein Harvfovirus2_38 [Harvfovirus sp.]
MPPSLIAICLWQSEPYNSLVPIYASTCENCGLNSTPQNLNLCTLFNKKMTKIIHLDIDPPSIKDIKLDYSECWVNVITISANWNEFCECPRNYSGLLVNYIDSFSKESIFEMLETPFLLIEILNKLETVVTELTPLFSVICDCWVNSIFGNLDGWRTTLDKETVDFNVRNNCTISSSGIEILDREIILLNNEIKNSLPDEFRDLIDCVSDYVSLVKCFNEFRKQVVSDGRLYIRDLADLIKDAQRRKNEI